MHLGNSIFSNLPVSSEKNIRYWSLLSGGYARGSKISHAGLNVWGKCIPFSKLHAGLNKGLKVPTFNGGRI